MQEALSLYRKLLLARGAEEKIRAEYSKDEMKTPVHLGNGGEAISVGVCHALPKGTKVFGTYRNHALYLSLTDDSDGFFGELYGKATGGAKGKAGSMHLSSPEHGLMATSAVVASTIAPAVGVALAHHYRRKKDVATVFFGDGAIEEGVFWESLNFACLKKLRVLFICEDNHLAIHTHDRDRRGFSSILATVAGFDCYRGGGDGSDLEVVVKETEAMLKKMATDPKPGLLHFKYLRFLEHVGPREDFEAGYRTRPSDEELKKSDPVLRYERFLLSSGHTKEALDDVKASIKKRIDESVRKAQAASFPDPKELWTDVFV